MEKKLNLGCGEFKKKGYVNVDYYSVSKPDIKHDLNSFPYPFKDNEFDLIEAQHLLEHLNNPMKAMKEIHGIAKNNAVVIIKVPHFSRGYSCPNHQRGFDLSFPYYFNPKFKGGYEKIEYQLEKLKLRWCAQPHIKKDTFNPILAYFLIIIGKIIDFFANLSPSFTSRIWAYWVGGFEEIEFKFRVIK